MPQNIHAVQGMAATLAVAALICAGTPRPASAGNDGTSGVTPHARKQVSPVELHSIQERCFRLLHKMKWAGDPLFWPLESPWPSHSPFHSPSNSPPAKGDRAYDPPFSASPTKDGWERMIRTPAFRICVERALEAKELGY